MNMVIDNAQQLIQAIEIVDLLGRYIKLKRIARLHWGLCPFHQEKTPSFVVNQDKNFFYCFGCGAGGNALSFISKYKKTSFIETIKDICDTYGWEYKFSEQSKEKYKQQRNEEQLIIQLFKDFSNICNQKLMLNSDALAYLENRGITIDMIRRFHIGYDDGHLGELINLGYDNISLKTYGILQEGDWSTSRFKNRIVLPICNPAGTIISLSSRGISSEIFPKYLHAIENPIFYKKTSFFNINYCVGKYREIYVVEGFFDMTTMILGGVENVVCCLGANMSEEQAYLLCKEFAIINIIFDGDLAGIKGMISAAIKLITYYSNTQCNFAILPEQQDPGSFFGKNQLSDLNFLSLEEFLWQYAIQIKDQILSGSTIVKMQNNIHSIINSVEALPKDSPTIKFLYNYWKKKLALQEKKLYSQFPVKKPLPSIINKDRILCVILLHKLEEIQEIIDSLSYINIEDPRANSIFNKIVKVLSYWEGGELQSMYEEIYNQLNPEEKVIINNPALLAIVNCDNRSLAQVIQQEFA